MQQAFENSRALATNLKKYVAAYSRGLNGSAKFRQQTLESQDIDTILDLTRSYFAAVEREPEPRVEGQAA
jgi:tRNA-dihydrouridine synthase